jgi:sulfide dehydrogenase cytochrome subunit
MVAKTITGALLVVGFSFGLSMHALAEDAKPAAAGAPAAAAAPAAPPKVISGASGQMLADTCAGCHGTDGASQGPASPTISGNSKKYIIELMEGFASGTIPSTVMGRIAKGYSKEEIEALADYYSAKPFVAAKQQFDQAKADAGAKTHDKNCEKCHAEQGSDVKDDTGRLAGQWMPYLMAAFEDFTSEKREMTKKMKNKVMELHTKDGMKAFEELANYYASQQK